MLMPIEVDGGLVSIFASGQPMTPPHPHPHPNTQYRPRRPHVLLLGPPGAHFAQCVQATHVKQMQPESAVHLESWMHCVHCGATFPAGPTMQCRARCTVCTGPTMQGSAPRWSLLPALSTPTTSGRCTQPPIAARQQSQCTLAMAKTETKTKTKTKTRPRRRRRPDQAQVRH